MTDKTKLLVHLRRIFSLFNNAFTYGPDGTLDRKQGAEHPVFIHYSSGFYLIGCLAYMEGENGSYSWKEPKKKNADFDVFASTNPTPPNESYMQKGISKNSLNALAYIRNAYVHNDGDLAKNYDSSNLNIVASANIPGVAINGSKIQLEKDFLGFVRQATFAVLKYNGKI